MYRKLSKTIPFGFKQISEDELEPVPEELEGLIIAKWYLDHGYTNQSTRDWLVIKTKRNITVPGMRVAVQNVERYREILGYTPEAPEAN